MPLVTSSPLFRSPLLADLIHVVLVEGGEWTAEELAVRVDAPYATVTKEIRRLERAGVLTTEVIGRTKFVSADVAEPAVRALARALALTHEGGELMSKKKDKKKDKKKKKK